MIKFASELIESCDLQILDRTSNTFSSVDLHESDATYFKQRINAGFYTLEPDYKVAVIDKNNMVIPVRMSNLFASKSDVEKYLSNQKSIN